MKTVITLLIALGIATTVLAADVQIAKTEYVTGKRTIRVQSGTYNGIPYIDMREVYTDEEGNEKFTKKGFAIKPDQIQSLISALKKM